MALVYEMRPSECRSQKSCFWTFFGRFWSRMSSCGGQYGNCVGFWGWGHYGWWYRIPGKRLLAYEVHMCVGWEVVEGYVGKKCLSTIFCQFWTRISGFNGQWCNRVGSCGLWVLWVMSWAGWAPFFTPWYVYCVEWRLMDDEIEESYFPAIFLIFWSVSSHLHIVFFCLKMVIEEGLKKRMYLWNPLSPWDQSVFLYCHSNQRYRLTKQFAMKNE
jgi:hypothetical protein